MDILASQFPNLVSFNVEVRERCRELDPRFAEWTYGPGDTNEIGRRTELKHDRTVETTCEFDPLEPVRLAALERKTTRSGKLRAYHTDESFSVSRGYQVKLVYKPEADPDPAQPPTAPS